MKPLSSRLSFSHMKLTPSSFIPLAGCQYRAAWDYYKLNAKQVAQAYPNQWVAIANNKVAANGGESWHALHCSSMSEYVTMPFTVHTGTGILGMESLRLRKARRQPREPLRWRLS